jgi:hypothetical protein
MSVLSQVKIKGSEITLGYEGINKQEQI